MTPLARLVVDEYLAERVNRVDIIHSAFISTLSQRPRLETLLPIEPRYFDAFVKEFKDVAHAIVYGNTVTAALQGAIGFAGLWLAGVPHAPVWGVAMAAVALIPVGGTALVWAPVGAALIATGRTSAGIFVLCWGAVVVGTIDNLIRPRLCGARMVLSRWMCLNRGRRPAPRRMRFAVERPRPGRRRSMVGRQD